MGNDAWKERRLCDLRNVLKEKKQSLWQDINAVDDPQAYYIPYENMEEAKRRVDFIDRMLKKHAKMFNTSYPVDYLFGNLSKRKAKLHPEQIAMEGMHSDADEAEEIDELIRVLRDPNWYFDEVHHVRQ